MCNGWEVIKALQRGGFVTDTQESSHYTMWHPETRRHATVVVHGGRDVKPGTLRYIISQAGLTVEEFCQLLK